MIKEKIVKKYKICCDCGGTLTKILVEHVDYARPSLENRTKSILDEFTENLRDLKFTSVNTNTTYGTQFHFKDTSSAVSEPTKSPNYACTKCRKKYLITLERTNFEIQMERV